jgi:DNA polymerase-3 subunit alpha
LRRSSGTTWATWTSIWRTAPERPREAGAGRRNRRRRPVVGLRKKGDSQMFVQIEDGRGRLECAFFAETYSEFAAMLVRDRLL